VTFCCVNQEVGISGLAAIQRLGEQTDDCYMVHFKFVLPQVTRQMLGYECKELTIVRKEGNTEAKPTYVIEIPQ